MCVSITGITKDCVIRLTCDLRCGLGQRSGRPVRSVLSRDDRAGLWGNRSGLYHECSSQSGRHMVRSRSSLFGLCYWRLWQSGVINYNPFLSIEVYQRLQSLQIGFALGFLIPPIVVTDHPDVEDIGSDLRRMFFTTSGITTAILLVAIFGISRF